MARADFLGAVQGRVILGDGAYGTEFLRRGCLRDRPLDELNLSRPHLVLALHREYRSAGAELLKTNTFQANRLRLAAAGLGDRTADIVRGGVELAREAARGAFVAGTVGPLGEFPSDAAKGEAFLEQCSLLAGGGCDLLLLETFTDWADLDLALAAAATTGLPVVAEVVGTPTGMEEIARRPDRLSLAGVNCQSPRETLKSLLWLQFLHRHLSGRLWSAFPSAGLPGEEISPEEFAAGAELLVTAGARLVGGCCGSGPDHVRAAAARIGGRTGR